MQLLNQIVIFKQQGKDEKSNHIEISSYGNRQNQKKDEEEKGLEKFY